MAQVPATPKLRRFALRLGAAVFGPASAARLIPVQPSEAAALALPRPVSRPESPEVLFLIPLVGRHHVGDWSTVVTRLSATLDSFRRQTDPQWRALICGQDRPQLPDDPRLTFLPFADSAPGNDKWRKLATLCEALAVYGPRDGYVMPFDADDLLASGAVAEMRTRRASGGYLVTHGYVHDASTQQTALARPPDLRQPRQRAFWKLCGSCAAFRYTGAGDVPFLKAATAHEHRMFPYLSALAGRPLTPLAQPTVLYLVNHGENFGVRRGRTGFKTRFVTRFPVEDNGILGRLMPEFGLSLTSGPQQDSNS